MLQNLFSIHQFWLTKWSFLVQITTRNAPYIHPKHDLIPENCNGLSLMGRVFEIIVLI